MAYFSATGTTKGVAEKIAAITGGDVSEADLQSWIEGLK